MVGRGDPWPRNLLEVCANFFWGNGLRRSRVFKKLIDPKGAQKQDSLPSCFRSILTFSVPRLQSLGPGVFCSVCSPLFLWTVNVQACPACHVNATKDCSVSLWWLRVTTSGTCVFPMSCHPIKSAWTECLCTVFLPVKGFLRMFLRAVRSGSNGTNGSILLDCYWPRFQCS